MVKKRESYRPFAPVVTAEAAADYFALPDTAADYEFMSFVVEVREDRRALLGAVTHVDGTARIQIIERAPNPRFYDLVKRFGELTGTPVLLNTSFNNNAEPIVQTAEDALTCFLTTGIDYLIIDDYLVRKAGDQLAGMDELIPGFRPVTRLAKHRKALPSGDYEMTYEIYLDYSSGSSAQISAQLYSLLEAVDGSQPLKSYLGSEDLAAELRPELFRLWQERFITLLPARG